jgi:hypothetical protein
VKKAEKKTKPKKRKRKLGVVLLNHRQNTIIILPNQETPARSHLATAYNIVIMQMYVATPEPEGNQSLVNVVEAHPHSAE